jgi:hypothetical protein
LTRIDLAIGHTCTVHWSKHSPKSRLFKICFLFSSNLCICGSFKSAKKLGSANRKSTNYESANHKKGWVRKLQMRKSPTFAEARKSNKLFKSENLPVCIFAELICGLPTFDSLTRFNLKVWWHYATLFIIIIFYNIHTVQSYIHSSFTVRRGLPSYIRIASSLSKRRTSMGCRRAENRTRACTTNCYAAP